MKRVLSKKYRTEWLLVALATLPAAVSLLGSWLTVDEGIWFQRSGSLMVMFAVWLEFRQATRVAKQKDHDVAISSLAGIPAISKMPEREFFHRIAIGLAIAGTLIWGYGDLLFFWQR